MHLTIFTESGNSFKWSVWLVNKHRSLRLWLAHLSHELIGKDKQNLTNVLPDSQWMYSVRLQKMYIFAHKETRKDILSTVVFRPMPWWITTIILTSAESTFLFGIYDHVSWNLLCETHYAFLCATMVHSLCFFDKRYVRPRVWSSAICPRKTLMDHDASILHTRLILFTVNNATPFRPVAVTPWGQQICGFVD